MNFRVYVFSPAYNVVRKIDVTADDEFEVVGVVEFILDDRGWTDPNCQIIVRENDTPNRIHSTQ